MNRRSNSVRYASLLLVLILWNNTKNLYTSFSLISCKVHNEAPPGYYLSTPWKWNETSTIQTNNRTKLKGTRGILLLHATQVPVPEVYQSAYGPEGKPHDKLILELILSIRKFSPALPVIVVVDEEPKPELAKAVDGYIKTSFLNSSSNETRLPWREKIPALMTSPFEETLYLDSDMKVCHRVEPLYGTLKSNDIGFVRMVPQASQKSWNKAAFQYDYYGCFILYRKSKQVYNFFEKAKTYNIDDQAALNKALNAINDITDLPNIFTFPAAAAAICRSNDLVLPVSGPVYTIHGVTAQCGNINSYLSSRYLKCEKGELQKDAGWKTLTFKAINYTELHS